MTSHHGSVLSFLFRQNIYCIVYLLQKGTLKVLKIKLKQNLKFYEIYEKSSIMKRKWISHEIFWISIDYVNLFRLANFMNLYWIGADFPVWHNFYIEYEKLANDMYVCYTNIKTNYILRLLLQKGRYGYIIPLMYPYRNWLKNIQIRRPSGFLYYIPYYFNNLYSGELLYMCR